jgi:hypothetical protein
MSLSWSWLDSSSGVGATLIIDGWMRRERRPDLAERLRPFAPATVADEAQMWLDQQEA